MEAAEKDIRISEMEENFQIMIMSNLVGSFIREGWVSEGTVKEMLDVETRSQLSQTGYIDYVARSYEVSKPMVLGAVLKAGINAKDSISGVTPPSFVQRLGVSLRRIFNG